MRLILVLGNCQNIADSHGQHGNAGENNRGVCMERLERMANMRSSTANPATLGPADT